MSEQSSNGSNRMSPLDAVHRALGAKMVPFGGWEMPIAYGTGTIDEHLRCRADAVVFDVSHLGTVRVQGAGAFAALQWALTNDLRRVAAGRAQYTHLLDPNDASVLDDIIVWWHAAGDATSGGDVFDVMPNASNTERVRDALAEAGDHDGAEVQIDDITEGRAILAVQGPHARERIFTFAPEAAAVGRFRVSTVDIGGVSCMVAGTGYTGEDGIEISVPVESAAMLWERVTASGAIPAGLGARDTLRLEAALPLHGHELGTGITSLQAGLGWVLGSAKDDYRGRAAVERERSAGIARHLVGVALTGRQPAREGASIVVDDEVVGTVTSGNFAPSLGHAIALGFVGPLVAVGTMAQLDVRGRRLDGCVVETPFVRATKTG